MVRTLPSVLPDTIALPSPTNFTSFAFFTVSEYSSVVTAPFAPVVLLEDTTQPMLRISPTVAAFVSGTALLSKLRNPFRTGALPFTLGSL